jgi:hypothetical protein
LYNLQTANKVRSAPVVSCQNLRGSLPFFVFFIFNLLFSRETSDVRTASSLASGMLLQYLTTCITCLVLTFTRSWALTLVNPLLTFFQAPCLSPHPSSHRSAVRLQQPPSSTVAPNFFRIHTPLLFFSIRPFPPTYVHLVSSKGHP